jgi:hypothetical protein
VHNDGGERGEGGVQDRSLFPPPVVPTQGPVPWMAGKPRQTGLQNGDLGQICASTYRGVQPLCVRHGRYSILPHLAGFQGSPPQTSHVKLPIPGRWPDSEPLTGGSTPPNIDIRINSSEAQSTGYPTGCSRRPLAVEPGSGLFKDAKPAIRLHEEVISRTYRGCL